MDIEVYVVHSTLAYKSKVTSTNIIVMPSLSQYSSQDTHSSWDDDKRSSVFSKVFHDRLWGDGPSVSGSGSYPALTEAARTTLSHLINTFNIKSLLDVGCGDVSWVSLVPEVKNINYTGIDIVQELVLQNSRKFHQERNMHFQTLDIVQHIPEFAYDLVIVKDVFIHLPPVDVLKALSNLSLSGSKYVLTTSFIFTGFNQNVKALEFEGDYKMINLFEPPFNIRSIVSLYLDRSVPLRDNIL
jgi:hypothetical protein